MIYGGGVYGGTEYGGVQGIEIITLDKWYQMPLEPVRVKQDINRGWIYIDPNILTQSESIGLDKWYIPISTPVKKRKRIVNTQYGFYVGDLIETSVQGLTRVFRRNKTIKIFRRN